MCVPKLDKSMHTVCVNPAWIFRIFSREYSFYDCRFCLQSCISFVITVHNTSTYVFGCLLTSNNIIGRLRSTTARTSLFPAYTVPMGVSAWRLRGPPVHLQFDQWQQANVITEDIFPANAIILSHPLMIRSTLVDRRCTEDRTTPPQCQVLLAGSCHYAKSQIMSTTISDDNTLLRHHIHLISSVSPYTRKSNIRRTPRGAGGAIRLIVVVSRHARVMRKRQSTVWMSHRPHRYS